MKEIKNIIFDFGVVLVDLNRFRFIENFKKIGVTTIESLTGTALHKGIFADFELGNVTPEIFCKEVCKLSQKEIEPLDVEKAWLSMLDTIPQYKLDKIIELRKHYRVYLLSNTNVLHWNLSLKTMFNYKGLTINDFFEKVWLSNELGMMKPDKSIFDFILNDGSIDPNETLFIDDAQPNCMTAQLLGIRTYQPAQNEDWRMAVDAILEGATMSEKMMCNE